MNNNGNNLGPAISGPLNTAFIGSNGNNNNNENFEEEFSVIGRNNANTILYNIGSNTDTTITEDNRYGEDFELLPNFGKRSFNNLNSNNNNNNNNAVRHTSKRPRGPAGGGRRKHSHTKKCKCPRKRITKRRSVKRITHRAPRK